MFEKAKGTTLLILEFPHNLASFLHNHHFVPHNIAENFRQIFYFFLHPIRWPVLLLRLVSAFP